MGWKPDNWKDLTDEQQDALKAKHRGENRAKRRAFWAKTWRLIDPLIKRAAVELADAVGDERREWVVKQVQVGADKLATAPGMFGVFLEKATDAVIYSPWFESLIDDKVQEAFDRLREAGEV